MGIERFDSGGEGPALRPEAGPPNDTGRPAEVPQPADSTPDGSSRPSPESADTEVKRAEPRTRSEYADHIAPPESPPTEADPPTRRTGEPGRPEDDPFKDESVGEHWSDTSSAEHQQAEGRPRLAKDLEGAHEQAHCTDNSPAYVDTPENRQNGKLDGDHPREQLELTSEHLGRNAQDADRTDEREHKEFIDALRHEDGSRENTHPELLTATTSEDSTRGFAQDHDSPQPVTPEEWTEHLAEVREGLDNARKAGLRTNQLHTIDRKGQIWSEERDVLHDSIIEDLYAQAADVPCNFKAIIAGGLGGAGKTTVLTKHAGIDLSQYLMINPDDFKEEMARRGMLPEVEGLSPMEASDLAHEESSYLAKRLARRAQTEGKNLIWDITMASQESTKDRIAHLREAGYTQVDGIFVDISIETSVKRTDSRHREGYESYRSGLGLGGRFVPPEVIRSQGDRVWSSQNRRTYEEVKDNFSRWTIYDNSADGRPAALIDSSKRRQ